MKTTEIRLCLYSIAIWVLLQSIAMAQPLSLSQLRDHALARGLTSGWFAQCTTHGSVNIAGAGKFTSKPDKSIALNFNRPSRYSIEFFSDGTQTRSVGAIEQKAPRHSPLGGLMFSIMNMQESLLDNHFKVDLSGSIDQFSISLAPKKRMRKMIQSINISGTGGLVDALQITTRNHRTISIRLFAEEPPAGVGCE